MNEKELALWKKLWSEHEEECWSGILKSLEDETKLKEIIGIMKEKLSEDQFNQFLDILTGEK